MADVSRCPQCGCELPPDAPGGLCPDCLLAVGLQTEDLSEQNAAASSPATSPPGGGFVAPSPDELAECFPQIEIQQLVGQGGMGAVYKAVQTKLGRPVALKIIRPEAAADPAFAERFAREARTLALLNHPHIITVYDFGEVDVAANGAAAKKLYYFIMEFVDGVNLRQMLAGGQLTSQQALAIVPQLCDALQFAHDEGIVHRDIKPENILIDRHGRVKIADFGLAKIVAQSVDDFTLTGTYQVMGTPRYMAPEQMTGSRLVDHRADIYSLGVVFYEMLTGDLPLGRFKTPSESAAVDARLDDVVLKTLQREPEARYQHASDVKSDVTSISQLAAAAPPLADTPAPATAPVREAAPRGPRQESSPDRQLQEARSQVFSPGVAMIVLGIVSLLMPLLIPTGTGVLLAMDAMRPGDLRGSPFEFPSALFVGLPAVPVGIMMLLAGIGMVRSRMLEMATMGCIAAMLPCSPLFLISLPMGIWALLVLRRKDIRAAFRQPEADLPPTAAAPWSARLKTAGLSIVMITVGTCNAALPLIVAFFVYLMLVDRPQDDEMYALALMCIPGAVIGVLMIVGGFQMRGFGSYGLAVIAAIGAMIPLSPLWLVNLPLGIWALMVLLAEDTKAAFGVPGLPMGSRDTFSSRPAGKPPMPADAATLELARRQLAGPAVGMICVSILSVLPIILMVVGVAMAISIEVFE